MRIGARSVPFTGSIADPGDGIARRKESESGLYAVVYEGCRMRVVKRESEVGRERSIVLWMSMRAMRAGF
jgi:hypothetical protein